MPPLTWDGVGTRSFETGISHGVLYLNDGTAVPWDGLTGVDLTGAQGAEPAYLDGRKYMDRDVYGEFAGTLTAFTYPDEFETVNGIVHHSGGMLIHDQKPKTFCMSFRSKKGDDVQGVDAGYKIHILYGLLAVAQNVERVTQDSSVTPILFNWSLTSTPGSLLGYRPTAHVVIDPTEFDPVLLAKLERYIYGTALLDPELPTLDWMTQFVKYAGAITITDHGDGTWSAAGPESNVHMLTDTLFEIVGANTTVVNPTTYTITTTDLT